MPRSARIKSKTGIYHIMIRGINRQNIFCDEEDYLKFLETLVRYKVVSEYKIYAYCLMTNHIHILIQPEKEDLDLIMKRIAGSYVYWYNLKYHRVGHLFQDRFKSEPVNDENYFLTVVRYIHQNPLKANIVKNIKSYEYSSFNDYTNNYSYLTDIDFVLSMMSVEEFKQFNNEPNDDECLEYSVSYKLNDIDAKEMVKEISGCVNADEFQKLESSDKDAFVSLFKEKGLSIRQICRLTGEKFSRVRK